LLIPRQQKLRLYGPAVAWGVLTLREILGLGHPSIALITIRKAVGKADNKSHYDCRCTTFFRKLSCIQTAINQIRKKIGDFSWTPR
jgi:hypothetical protein